MHSNSSIYNNSGTSLDSYSGRARFESQPGHPHILRKYIIHYFKIRYFLREKRGVYWLVLKEQDFQRI
jgi:hypothetical protein